MGKIGKITSVKRAYSASGSNPQDQFGIKYKTMEASLADLGFSRIPGAGARFVPFRENSGEYRTGLDPNATYIKRLGSKGEQDQEIKRVTDELERLMLLGGGVDLSPKSPFFTQMFNRDMYDSNSVARSAKLTETNLFRLDDFMESVTFAWLRVHPDIAPSLPAWRAGKFNLSPFPVDPSKIYFFVDDEEWEAEQIYKDNVVINRAISLLDNMDISKRIRVGKLCGLPLSPGTKESVVYNELTKFLKDTSGKSKLANINLFNKFSDMADDKLKIRYLVREAIELNIYRTKNGRVLEGEMEVAQDEESLILNLSSAKYQEDLIALEEKIKEKRMLVV